MDTNVVWDYSKTYSEKAKLRNIYQKLCDTCCHINVTHKSYVLQ